jgi:carbonic anhydrase
MRTLAAFILVTIFSLAAARADAPAPKLSADDALERLATGNRAFVAAGGACPRQSAARRTDVAGAQHPIAVIIGCADSRVPPEAIFGQGIGDLFIVRVAGNVVDDTVLGSVEYAVEHLGVSLVVVLGHERCGAVEAALGTAAPHAHVGTIVRRIRAAIAAVRSRPGDALDNAVRANVAASVNQVRSAKPLLAPAVQKGDVKVVGGRYDLDTGVVEILP